MTPADSIRKLTQADIPRSVEVMSRSFFNDPLWLYIEPDDAKRAKLLPKVFGFFVSLGIQNGQAWGVGDPLLGFSVWSAPGEKEAFGVNGAFLRLVFSPVIFSFFKTAPVFSQFQRMQKQYAPDPHFYLNTIGVHPDGQGKGLASKLIRPFLAQADAQGVNTYTETMTPSNVPLYEHYGFQVMEQYRVLKTDLCIWSLFRTLQR